MKLPRNQSAKDQHSLDRPKVHSAAKLGLLTLATLIILSATLWIIYAETREPEDRELYLRGCFICHTDNFHTILPCMKTWERGQPVRNTLRDQLHSTHPTLAGGNALERLSDTLTTRQLHALAATHQQDAGAALYSAKCAACHGKQGEGQTDLYPPLMGSEWLTATPSRLPEILSSGLQGPITVKGEKWEAIMLAPGLTPSQQQAVIDYIRARFTRH